MAAPGRGVSWKKAEILDLLDIFGEQKVQAQLNASHRNLDAYESIAQEMQRRGHIRTAKECRTKAKAMRQEYRRVVNHNSRSGNDAATCPFFEELHSIFRGDATIQPNRVGRSLNIHRVQAPAAAPPVSSPLAFPLSEGSEELFSSELQTIDVEDYLGTPYSPGELETPEDIGNEEPEGAYRSSSTTSASESIEQADLRARNLQQHPAAAAPTYRSSSTTSVSETSEHADLRARNLQQHPAAAPSKYRAMSMKPPKSSSFSAMAGASRSSGTTSASETSEHADLRARNLQQHPAPAPPSYRSSGYTSASETSDHADLRARNLHHPAAGASTDEGRRHPIQKSALSPATRLEMARNRRPPRSRDTDRILEHASAHNANLLQMHEQMLQKNDQMLDYLKTEDARDQRNQDALLRILERQCVTMEKLVTVVQQEEPGRSTHTANPSSTSHGKRQPIKRRLAIDSMEGTSSKPNDLGGNSGEGEGRKCLAKKKRKVRVQHPQSAQLQNPQNDILTKDLDESLLPCSHTVPPQRSSSPLQGEPSIKRTAREVKKPLKFSP